MRQIDTLRVFQIVVTALLVGMLVYAWWPQRGPAVDCRAVYDREMQVAVDMGLAGLDYVPPRGGPCY